MLDVQPKTKLVYCDPAWNFKTYRQKGKGRSAEAHYDCMSIEEICQIPVADWVDKDSVLLMWVIDPMLPQAMQVMQAWGFTFKTVGFYWAKLNKSVTYKTWQEGDFFTGLGYYRRANVEQCWLGTRGHPKRLARDVRKLVISPRREHSRKPDCVYERIERLFDGPYLEMFARSTRPGWSSWGNEVGLFDGGSVDTRRIPSDLSKYQEETPLQ